MLCADGNMICAQIKGVWRKRQGVSLFIKIKSDKEDLCVPFLRGDREQEYAAHSSSVCAVVFGERGFIAAVI